MTEASTVQQNDSDQDKTQIIKNKYRTSKIGNNNIQIDNLYTGIYNRQFCMYRYVQI